jgi:hypothetical protein
LVPHNPVGIRAKSDWIESELERWGFSKACG